MQSLYLVVFLTVLSLKSDAASQNNINVGTIAKGDKLLSKSCFDRGAVANTIQNQTVTFRGSSAIRISAIKATEQGESQNATATITAGGVGRNLVTIRLSSAKGGEFHYVVEIWGR